MELQAGCAAIPDPGRPKNAYVREDRIFAQLPALYLLLTGAQARKRRRRRTRRGADVPRAVTPDEAIGYLREHEIPLTWDPTAGIVQADTAEATKTVTGKAS